MKAKRTLQNSLIVATCIILISIAWSRPSFAEGSLGRDPGEHAYGVNRKVNSSFYKFGSENRGYTGVTGHFSAAVVASPPSKWPTSDPENYNHYNTKPTAYLGSHTGESSNQVDAGIQYYSDKVTYPSGKILLPGWGPFINCKGNLVTPAEGVFDPVSGKYYWEGYRDSASGIDYTMTYRVVGSGSDKGKVKITVDGGAFDNLGFYGMLNSMPERPTSAGQLFPPRTATDAPIIYANSGDINALHMKRVIGITQGNTQTYELDGSLLIGTFSNGKLFKQDGSSEDWSYSAVEQSQTGYDVPETAKDAQWDNDDTLASTYIVTFPNIQAYSGNGFNLDASAAQAAARKNADPSKYLQENDTSRYSNETIQVTLYSATRMKGKSTVRQAN